MDIIGSGMYHYSGPVIHNAPACTEEYKADVPYMDVVSIFYTWRNHFQKQGDDIDKDKTFRNIDGLCVSSCRCRTECFREIGTS